jgi:hypothetical protein
MTRSAKGDPRPACRFCGRRWTPEEGVDAGDHFCAKCVVDRQAAASTAFSEAGTETVQIGDYDVQARKNF